MEQSAIRPQPRGTHRDTRGKEPPSSAHLHWPQSRLGTEPSEAQWHSCWLLCPFIAYILNWGAKQGSEQSAKVLQWCSHAIAHTSKEVTTQAGGLVGAGADDCPTFGRCMAPAIQPSDPPRGLLAEQAAPRRHSPQSPPHTRENMNWSAGPNHMKIIVW